ncbi:hypothetical protein CHS0354_027259 [Potamilus streckersoni]|uniref:Uncharacterized protein n=1 Tax=Potamilus streckersoni TaxID=2493646 RepID=A0AAE0VL97_9BIVA|nr:hypothetical protein CHS0354_027259 [Potamilus streckersoni]
MLLRRLVKLFLGVIYLQLIQARIIPTSTFDIKITYNICRNHGGTVSLNVNVPSRARDTSGFLKNELMISLHELQETVKGEKNDYTNRHRLEADTLHHCMNETDSKHRRDVLHRITLDKFVDASFVRENSNDVEDRTLKIFRELSFLAMLMKVFDNKHFECCSVTLPRQLYRKVQSAISYTKMLRNPFHHGGSCHQRLTLTLEDCTDVKDAGYILLHHMEKKLLTLIEMLPIMQDAV